jgi:capsular polysaccharide biosynthesis protein
MNGETMEEIDLKELFNVFWSKKIFIIIVTILFAIVGWFYTMYMVKPIYKSTATLVLTKSDSTDETTITQTEVTLNQQLVATYTELIKTKNILGEVIQNLGYDDITEEELKDDITVELVTSTQWIELSVKNSNPERARDLANEIANVFVERESEIYKLNNISKVDEAKISTTPDNINHKKDIALATIIGFIVALGIVFIRSLFDTTIKNSEEAEKRLGLTVLASIPQYDYEMKKKGKK